MLGHGGEAQSSALAAATASVQQNPQLMVSSRARMQILTSDVARTVWTLLSLREKESVLGRRMGDVFGYLCHQVKDCRRMSVDIH